ncbi:hypothetical protein C8R45DRAFT_932913 [Mycena sanguinolenta]|nr:hypothetical protein C8R45DRAFT_932913 [Mycena sanguinolenta]
MFAHTKLELGMCKKPEKFKEDQIWCSRGSGKVSGVLHAPLSGTLAVSTTSNGLSWADYCSISTVTGGAELGDTFASKKALKKSKFQASTAGVVQLIFWSCGSRVTPPEPTVEMEQYCCKLTRYGQFQGFLASPECHFD